MSAPTSLLQRFARDERGVFAVIFGVMAVVLIALGGAVVDYVRLEQTRQRAQTALDAAVLALQPDILVGGMTETRIRERAEALVLERIGDSEVEASIDTVRMDPANGSLFIDGHFSLPTIFVQLVGVPELRANFRAEAVRGALDIEVAVALDVTGSMQGQRIVDLRNSITDLMEAVVADDQTLNYSKMALIPYSQAVNAGSYAEAVRGPIRAPVETSTFSWSTGTTKTITGATKANPVTITSNGHGFSDGDWVYIWNSGMSQISNKPFMVTGKTANTFRLSGIDGRNYTTFSGTASVIKCQVANCNLVVTSNSHGFNNGDYAYFTNVGGSHSLNGNIFQVSNVTPNSLALQNTPAGNGGTYTNNTGLMHCTWQTVAEGCTYYRYQGSTGLWRLNPVTTCVTERASNGLTDVAPTVSYVGRNYPPPGNGCLANTIVPLTANKAALRTAINALAAVGSTSGSLGVVWSWLMLSPNFAYVWPFDSRPAAYNTNNLLKAAVIMTDGEFNTVHCNGVVARNSTSGSGSTADHINCNAPNGSPYAQAQAYCDAMKASNITVYTVGFAISEGTPAANVLRYCASGASNYFLASSGAQLRQAFQQIGANISALRITR